MPAMSTDELVQVVKQGYDLAGLKAKRDVFERIGRMSQGLPHYAHRIGQESGFAALDHERTEVTIQDIETGVNRATELTNETISASYAKAITVPKPVIFTGRLSLHARWREMIIGDILLRRTSDPLLPISPRKITGYPNLLGISRSTVPERRRDAVKHRLLWKSSSLVLAQRASAAFLALSRRSCTVYQCCYYC